MKSDSKLVLSNGSRVGVIGGGPAGSFFGCFLLDMALGVDMNVQVDIYEAREFGVQVWANDLWISAILQGYPRKSKARAAVKTLVTRDPDYLVTKYKPLRHEKYSVR